MGPPWAAATRRIAAALVMVTLLAGTAPAQGMVAARPSPVPPEAAASAAPNASAVPAMPFPTDAALIAILADAGVAVMADEAATEPIIPVIAPQVTMVTSWQAATMAAELRVAGGMRGSDLDRALRLGKSRLPFSYLLAAWISTDPGASAQALRTAMGAQDWTRASDVLYPSAALTLFAAAAARAIGTAGEPGPSASAVPSPSADAFAFLAGPLDIPACSTITGFVNDAMSSLFSALRIKTGSLGTDVGSSFLGFIAPFWNTALTLAEGIVKAAVTELTRPVTNAIKDVIAGAALVSQVTSYLKPWVIAIGSSPSALTLPLGGTGLPGSFRARADVSAVAQQWPPLLLDCASALKVELPSLAVAGAPVRWTTSGAGAAYVTLDGGAQPVLRTLDKDQTSTLGWTSTVDPVTWEDGDLVQDAVRGSATLQRREVTQLLALIKQLTVGRLPSGIDSIVQAVIGPIVDGLLSKAGAAVAPLLDARGASEAVTVSHRKPPTPVGLRLQARLQSKYHPRVWIDLSLRSCDARGRRWTGLWVAHRPPGLVFKRKVGFDFKAGDTARWSVTTTEPLGSGTITGTHDYEFTRTLDGAGVTETISIDGIASANGVSVPESETYPGVGVPVPVEMAPDACG
jgi:hypothetical protein